MAALNRIAAHVTMRVAWHSAQNGGVKLVHECVERAENCPCYANSQVGNNTGRKYKVDETSMD
jgi:hypothetical protein